MLTRRGSVPDAVWDYVEFHAHLLGGYGSVERLAIPQPVICLFRWQDEHSLKFARVVKHWCVVYAPAPNSQPFRLLTHWIITRERALPGDSLWRLQALPHVSHSAWQKRIMEDARLLQSATTAMQLGVVVADLLERRF